MKRILLLFAAFVLGLCLYAQDQYNMEFTAANEEAATLLREGMEAMYHNNFSEAKTKLEKTLEIDPGNFMASYMLSDAYAMMGDAEKSKTLKEQAMSKTEGLNNNERVIQEMERHIMKHDMKTAAMIASRLPRLNPGNFEALMWATYANMRAGEVETGLSFANQATAIYDDVGALHNMIGYMNMEKGDMPAAKAAFERYLDLDPEGANAYDSMGDYHMAAGEYAQAKKMFEKAYKLDKTMTLSKEKAAKAAEKMAEKG